MKKEEEYEFELEKDEFEEVGVPLEETPEHHEEIEADFDEVYSDDAIEDLLVNDEVSSFEAGFMHGYLDEAEEGA
ncbi:MAG: hypothetical protein AABX70_04535 [Nanoarchaeota archaeon]